mgnify:CR=1 FL=1
MKKRLTGVILMLTAVLTLLTPLTIQAAGGLDYVTDAAGILSDDEWSELEGWAQDVTARHDCGVYIITVDDYTEYNDEDAFYAASDIYHGYEMGEGDDRNGVMLLLSMDNRKYAIYVYGPWAQEAFGDYAQVELENVFLDNFGDDDWYGGFSDYIETCDEYLQLAEEGTPVTEPELGVLGAFMVALVVSSVIALIVCFLLKLKMRSVHKGTSADTYTTGGLKLTAQRDNYTHTTHIRRKIETESDSSSSSHSDSSGGTGRSGSF